MAAKPFSARITRVACGVVLAAALLAAHASFAAVPVRVDGRRVLAHPGATVGETAAERLTAARGDLVAASDRRVLIRGAGEGPRVLRNGVPASTSDVVRPGDDIRVLRGKDVIEKTVERLETIPVPTEVTGKGALLTLAAPGMAGVARVVTGAVSGDVVASETVRPAEPMVLKRVIDTRRKKVALTFDDGPWPRQTEAIARILESEGVPATFFVIGKQVKAHPDIVRGLVQAGHVVGNHTYQHVDLSTSDGRRLASEIAETNRAIRAATGVTPRWIRPPGGAIDADAYEAAARQHLRVVLWTVDPQDWRRGKTAAQIEAEVVRATTPGAVILLHDGGGDRSQTIAALPGIIRQLRARGYEFVPLADLGVVKAAW
ncbi:MAG: polysaccharide deacetylase family protein [Coriobacteriia bacterium]|nr:polysaccharide deacetylase family protein [Coriobacteriia bacterium]